MIVTKPKRTFLTARAVGIAGGAILLVILCMAAWLRVRHLRASAVVQWESRLGGVADLTKFAIEAWIGERRAEAFKLAEFAGDRPLLFANDRRPSSIRRRVELNSEIQEHLSSTQVQNSYSGVWITDAAGRVISRGKEGISPGRTALDAAADAVRLNKCMIIGPRCDDHGVLTLIVAAPVLNFASASQGVPPAVLGTALLTLDPSVFLFSLLKAESIPTQTGEYMLVVRVGDEFQILSPHRHPPAPPPSVRLPWAQAPLLGRLAIEGQNTAGEFTDFRGEQMIGVARHISATVGLIGKVDKSEAFSAYHAQARTEGLLGITILAMVAFAMLAFTRAQRVSRLREVAASESRLKGIIDTAMDAIITLDGEQRVTLFNAGAEKMFDCKASEALGQPLDRFIPERFREAHRKHIDAFGRSGETSRLLFWKPDMFGLRRSGEVFPIEGSISHLATGGQKIYAAMIRDISERKQAERLLRKTEENYRALFEESKEAVFISSVDGKLLDINPAGVDLFGYSAKEELLQVDIAKDLYFNPLDREENRRVLESTGFLKDFELTLKRKDGTKRIVLETSTPVRNEQGKIVAYRGFLRDITHHRALENQLFQAQKMEAIGQLAGGVAHDFNNILTAILGYSDLLRLNFPEGGRHRRNIDEIAKAAKRAASLTQQLLAFSRRQFMQPKVVTFNDLVADIDKMLRRLISENIELVTVLEPDLGYVVADPGQIEQVIMNLVVNARDAMPKGGKLVIATGNVELDEAFAAQHIGARPGRCVMLSVSDTGHGMDAEVQSHIFEPFFTTKEMGKGTGLGLSTVYGIVKQSGGYISVQSEPGKGTAFQIYLPRVDAPKPVAEAAGAPAEAVSGSETILLVEDEESVRTLACDVLRGFDYKVLEAGNGEDAVALCRHHQDSIDLLVTDMVMPGMSGRDLAWRLESLYPEMKVLYVSGYMDVSTARNSVLDPGSAFLPKPFTPLELMREVRRLLESSSAEAGGLAHL